MTEEKKRFVDHLIQQVNRERLLPPAEGAATRVPLLRSILASAFEERSERESSVQFALGASEAHTA